MTAYSLEDIKLYGRGSQMTMYRAKVHLDFHYSGSEFYANRISFEVLKKFSETKNNKKISKQLK
jgi:hypothetical protein